MRALHVHHDPNSLPGLVGEVLDERGVQAVTHQVCETPGSPTGSAEFPDPGGFDLVVVYGSRWSVDDPDAAHWVLPELEMLRVADAAGVPVLGLCFGGQLLSAAHGGGVERAPEPEVGWFTVEPEPAQPQVERGPWLQWHFDRFSVPDGAELLASSPVGPQAFRLRRNLALQFHPEVDRAVIEAWFVDDLDQIAELGLDPDELLAETERQRDAAHARAARLVDTFHAWSSPAR
jgi:GMP synthase-like glutamine amidotransferase